MTGSIAFCRNGNFIVGLTQGIYFIDRKSGQLKMIANPEANLPDNRFNDGKCDLAGRILDRNAKRIEDTTISNGMWWSIDLKTFYFIDKPTMGIASYDYDDRTGNFSNRKRAIKFQRKMDIRME